MGGFHPEVTRTGGIRRRMGEGGSLGTLAVLK